jgi:hypothetical protein
MEIDEFIENHQQSKEGKDDRKKMELHKNNLSANLGRTMMVYVALKDFRNSHCINNTKLFYAVCRAKILIENQASWPTTYMQKTLLQYWKQ